MGGVNEALARQYFFTLICPLIKRKCRSCT